jgi:hypothetical protein
MTDWELLALNKIGFIPGPGESESDFSERVSRTKKNFEKRNSIPPAHWDLPKETLLHTFDVNPLYICAFYSDKNLTPWQGAATWIEGSEIHSVQLRTSFSKGSFLGIYSRSEILAHEAVHAARCAFQEDRFEEYFAYMTSSKKWRRVLGPILKEPWEAWPFLICMTLGVFFPSAFLAAVLWIFSGFVRLIKGHRTLAAAYQVIFDQVKDHNKTRAILFRLTDREIERFAKGEKIERYNPKLHDLRWKIIQNYCE